jgi:hypothetical protein
MKVIWRWYFFIKSKQYVWGSYENVHLALAYRKVLSDGFNYPRSLRRYRMHSIRRLAQGYLLGSRGRAVGDSDVLMYEEIAAAGGLSKPTRVQKKRARLKSHYKPIPRDLKEAVLETKGRLCFMGHCPNCGAAPVGIDDDQHHFPHKSRGGKDCIEHLWPCRRECHEFVHTHPAIEREMLREIEAAGIPVVWKAQTKGIGYQEAG